jgi:hypothetical protein
LAASQLVNHIGSFGLFIKIGERWIAPTAKRLGV